MAVAFAWAVAIATPSLAQVAGGAASAGAEDRTRPGSAKAHHRAGVAAYAQGRYRDAIDAFIKADRLRPSAALSFNVARAYEQMSDVSSALAWYRNYLRRAPLAPDGQRVTVQIAQLEKRLAQRGVQQVTVDSAPRGATVLIDGSPVGVTPWTGDLVPGTHSLELTLRGFKDLSAPFELSRDRALHIELTLRPALAPAGVPGRAPEPMQRSMPEPLAESQPGVDIQQGRSNRHAPENDATLTTLGWIASGSGVAALGTALGFELARQSAEEAAEDETRQIQFAKHLDTMRERQMVARVLGGAGAALVVTGGVLLLVNSGGDEVGAAPSPGLVLGCAPMACRAALTGRF